ncbi:hypothetical protein [Ruminococcus flavefaciens]|uniref:hypothetical protein n=1 Tax=Ruminococcus flavefaciens TaxID=1265 RepID=UPI0026EC2313|nr:hypothetical protein [Ruminococcus flavefaciens]
MNEKNNINLAKSASEEISERKKMQKAALIKIGAMLVLSAILFIFSSIAWFTNNKEVSESGLQMTAGGIPFTIEFPGEDEGYWIDQYHNLSNQTGIWLVDDDKNMDNGSGTTEEKLGLEPGDSGTLEFRISPNETDTITVDICFTMRGIVKQHDQNNSQQLTEISDTELMGFVASHIMLFTGIDSNGKYTGLIQNSSDLKRYIRNKTYSINDSEEDDDYYTTLYWVWPLHLSNLISTQSDDLIYASSERSTVIQYMVAHKNGFFKDITTEDSVLSADLNSMEHYGSYSIMFDKADLDIGKRVQYVILGLSVE